MVYIQQTSIAFALFVELKIRIIKTLLKIRSIINGEYESEEEDVFYNFSYLTPGHSTCSKNINNHNKYKSILRSNRRPFVFKKFVTTYQNSM